MSTLDCHFMDAQNVRIQYPIKYPYNSSFPILVVDTYP